MADAERDRLAEVGPGGHNPWKRWGPYLAERAWGTVREDYSADGDAWSYFPHHHAHSRAFRWNEDGLAGISDRDQVLCLALSLWNGADPILKERVFGLTGPQGNHGEDPKEYWFYLDSTPTHSYMAWRYFYPQREFPYADLVAENARRGRFDPEYELLDTGIFDEDRYFDVTAEYAKASPEDLCVRVRVRNAGPDPAPIDVLPTLWFRNTWSWGLDDRRPSLRAEGAEVVAEHPSLGRRVLAGDGSPELLFCENESNAEKLWGTAGSTPYPKDGINDHVVHGAATVNPAQTGTKAALRYSFLVQPGETVEVRIRLTDDDFRFGAAFERVFADRKAEADEFYDALTPADATPDEAMVMRQAFGGMLWTKQFYHYDVSRWLAGDPAFPPPPGSRWHGRNRDWHHMDNHDVISMPDKWEYPWYAVWDSAFHCVALAHVDVDFAKEQLLLFLREWYLHPNGQIPAYEWNFGDVNPPVHAWAALRVYQIDGSRDHAFLARVFQKLLLNFTWWVNKKDAEGNNVFEGGFLGLDNIGPIDRSAELPGGVRLEQSDGTSWMAMYSLNMLTIALTLAQQDPTYEDIASKFFEHFAHIASAINTTGVTEHGLWDESDGLYYDIVHLPGRSEPLRVRSMVGLIPLYAVETLGKSLMDRFPEFAKRKRWFLRYRTEHQDLGHLDDENERGARLLSIVSPARLRRVLEKMLDESEFFSPHGIRALSAYHRANPLNVDLGGFHASVGYEPAESNSPMFGGNSNWRGPVWFPVNYLLVESLREYHKYVGGDFKVECPTGSGRMMTLDEVADELTRRLVAIFLDDAAGRRPVFGGLEKFQSDPEWHDCVPFHEYFHGDNGAGIGAPHQLGWTGLVADLVTRRRFPKHA
jgi:hypothetical protein